MRREVAEAKLAALGQGAALARARQGDERSRAERADDALDGSPLRSPERGHAVLAPATSPASPARRVASSTRCGRRGTRCRSMRTCATAAATGAGATRASSSTAGGSPRAQRAHWQPVEYNALHGGLERWFEPIEAA
jgi:hypothetical protein